MFKEKNKIILLILVFILFMIVLSILDKINVITKFGLSPTLWSAMIVGIFPIVLTVILWQKEEKDRKEQINKETTLQKKLIVRTAYVSYFEELLEQINKFSIFLKAYIINQNNILGEKRKEYIKIRSLLTAISLEKDRKVWDLEYRTYPFKAIGIDIFKYQYKDEEINFRAYMPYLGIKNDLEAIFRKERIEFSISGGYLEELEEKDLIKIANNILANREAAIELYDFLIFMKEDIENRISFSYDEKN